MQHENRAELEHFTSIFTEHDYPRFHAAFMKSAVVKRFNAGDVIVFQEDNTQRLGYVTSGEADIHMTSFEGDTIIAERFPAGSILNAPRYIDGKSSPVDVIAVEPCTVHFLTYRVLKSDPVLDAETIRLVAHCSAGLFRIAEKVYRAAMLLPLKERIIHRLFLLMDENNSVEITAEKLASYLGVSKYKVHRALNELEKENRIVNTYGSVTLVE
ncbi:Crp/Fnr family transcriptional regulator [Photobacterium sp. DNB22_13_2]